MTLWLPQMSKQHWAATGHLARDASLRPWLQRALIPEGTRKETRARFGGAKTKRAGAALDEADEKLLGSRVTPAHLGESDGGASPRRHIPRSQLHLATVAAFSGQRRANVSSTFIKW